MKFEEVNNKEADSFILSLEQLNTEYENTLNMYNQVQQELNTFSNSEWQLNPYLNKNIQFTGGEVAYVTISGSVYLYGFLQNLQNKIQTDENIVSQDQSNVINEQTLVNNQQQVVNSQQNILNQAQQSFNNESLSQGFSQMFDGFTTMREGMSGLANMAAGLTKGLNDATNFFEGKDDSTIDNSIDNSINKGVSELQSDLTNPQLQAIYSEQAQLTSDKVQLGIDETKLYNASSQLSFVQNNLNVAEAALADVLGELNVLGCPSTTENLVQVNLPWLPEYNEPYSLIPTNPPLLTMGQFVYQNGNIGFTVPSGSLNRNIGFSNQAGVDALNESIGISDSYGAPSESIGSFGKPFGAPSESIGSFGIPFSSGSGISSGGCDALNATLKTPPYDIVPILNSSYNAVQGPQLNDTNIQTCEAYCSVSAYCSGANFNTSTNTCTLMSGPGVLTPTQNTIALIPQITQYLLRLSQLNFRLTQINDQIVKLTKKGQPYFVKDNTDNKIENKLLLNRYKKLIIERKKIDDMIDKIGIAQNEENYEGNVTSTTYLKYGLLLCLVVIILIILANISRSTEHMNSDGKIQTSLFLIIFVVVFIVFGVIILRNFVTGTSNY